VAIIGFLDYVTGPELAFSIFYLFPVTVATLGMRKLDTFLICILSAITWLWADVAWGSHYSHWIIPHWNASVLLGFFLLHATLLGTLLRSFEAEKDLARRDPLTGQRIGGTSRRMSPERSPGLAGPCGP
jgi:hypothetical protein